MSTEPEVTGVTSEVPVKDVRGLEELTNSSQFRSSSVLASTMEADQARLVNRQTSRDTSGCDAWRQDDLSLLWARRVGCVFYVYISTYANRRRA